MLRTTANVSPRSDALQDFAADQKELAASAEGLRKRVAKLGKASPFIAVELQQLIGDAISNMETAVEKFTEKRGHQAQAPQRTAMTDLNKISLRLMESLQAQKECKNGSQCSNPMQKLESMCDKQNSLNQETKKECNNPGSSAGGAKQGQTSREALKRLAQEQATIRKSMEQLSRESGGSRQLLGRLDDIAKEMKKVEEALESGETGLELNQRQLKIYSRMLEASRSLQRKDFSEQRRATTSDTQAIFLPPALSSDLLNNKVKLEDRLKQFLGEGYPKQYEEQVKAYFKALLQSEAASDRTWQP
jgi:archaellum component FlaC